jgi:predicted RNA polymerase sigma factor
LQQNKQWDAILDTVEQGLKQAPPQSPVAEELSVLQIEALDALGRPTDVQAAAQAYLQGSSPARATDMRRFLVASFIAQSDCQSAMPHLDILLKESTIAEDYLNYATCIAPIDVKSARKNLEKSLQLSDNPEQRAAIQAHLDKLRNED